MKFFVLLLKPFLLALILITAFQISIGQEKALVLKNKFSNSEKIIASGRDILISFGEVESHRLKFKVYDSNSIILGSDTILLSDINRINYRKKNIGIATFFLAGGGAVSTLVGGVLIGSDIATGELFGYGTFFSLPFLAVGIPALLLAVKLNMGKNYYSEDWSFIIR